LPTPGLTASRLGRVSPQRLPFASDAETARRFPELLEARGGSVGP
jgi:hypothetical protein